MAKQRPTPDTGTDVEPEVPVTIEPTQVRPDDEGRIQYEDEVTHDESKTDVAKRPSNPNQLPPTMPIDE